MHFALSLFIIGYACSKLLTVALLGSVRGVACSRSGSSIGSSRGGSSLMQYFRSITCTAECIFAALLSRYGYTLVVAFMGDLLSHLVERVAPRPLGGAHDRQREIGGLHRDAMRVHVLEEQRLRRSDAWREPALERGSDVVARL